MTTMSKNISKFVSKRLTNRRHLANGIPNLGQNYYYDGTIENDELVAKQGAVNIPIISYGSGSAGDALLAGDAVLDMTAFGEKWNKANVVGGSTGLEYWDSPFKYSSAVSDYYWEVDELNYRYLENMWLFDADFNQGFAKLIYDAGVLQGLSELLIYDTENTETVEAVKSYIGIIAPFVGDNLLSNDQSTFDTDTTGDWGAFKMAVSYNATEKWMEVESVEANNYANFVNNDIFPSYDYYFISIDFKKLSGTVDNAVLSVQVGGATPEMDGGNITDEFKTFTYEGYIDYDDLVFYPSRNNATVAVGTIFAADNIIVKRKYKNYYENEA